MINESKAKGKERSGLPATRLFADGVTRVMAYLPLVKMLPWLVLAAGLTATYLLQQVAFNAAQQIQQSEFVAKNSVITLRIMQRLAAYEQVLLGVQGLYSASQSIDKNEFRDYVTNLRIERHYPGIQGIGFSQIIPAHNETNFEAAIPNHSQHQERDSDIVTSAIYLEPNNDHNQRRIGNDMYTDTVLRAAMTQARDSDQSIMSGKIPVKMETDQETAGFIIYVPVYHNNLPHEDITERQANIIGWVYALFDMNDLMIGTLGDHDGEIDYEIFDSLTPSHDSLMYDADGILSLHKYNKSLYHSTKRIEIMGHTWTINFHSLPSFEANIDTGRVALIRLAGIVMSILLSLLVWQLANTRTRALKLARDMTHKLRESEARLAQTLTSAELGTWDWNIKTGHVISNDRRAEIRGYRLEDVKPDVSTWHAGICTEDLPLFEKKQVEHFEGKSMMFDAEYRVRTKSGALIWVMDRGTVTERDEGGNPLRMIGIEVDITERKLAEDMLRIAAITFEAHEGITVTDSDANIIRVNKAFEHISGYSQEEVLGKNNRIFQSGRHDKDFYAAMWQQLQNNGLWSGELWNKRKDGEIYPLRVTITAVKNTRGETTEYVSIFNDITESKQAEAKLQKNNQDLIAINHQLQEAQNQLLQSEKMASIGQLAAGVAHEINNPIGYVYSNLGTLEKYVQDTVSMIESYEQAEDTITDEAMRTRLQAARKKLDIDFLKEDLHELMSESKDGIIRVKNIVQNLKDFSHVDTTDEWHFANLHNGLNSTLNIVNNEIKYKANVIKEYGALPEVECLPSQLNQVFMNLLVNAAHAIEERGTITIRTGTQEENVWVEVEDTGKGIAPEFLKKIFDPFFTTKPIGKGTGLGLSLSYGIIQKHHGRIDVESEENKGTRFKVWLPVKQSQDGER